MYCRRRFYRRILKDYELGKTNSYVGCKQSSILSLDNKCSDKDNSKLFSIVQNSLWKKFLKELNESLDKEGTHVLETIILELNYHDWIAVSYILDYFG